MGNLPVQHEPKVQAKVHLTCAASLVSEFEISFNIKTVATDLSLQKVLFTRQMQQYHNVDLTQCYWDWQEDHSGKKITVFVISRDVVNRAIAKLPTHLRHCIEGIFSLKHGEDHCINLWPWRDTQNQRRRRQWLIGLGIGMLSALLFLLLGRLVLNQFAAEDVARAQQLDQSYQHRSQLLNQQLKQREAIHNNTAQNLSWFGWLARNWPSEVRLISLELTSHQMQLQVQYDRHAALQGLLDRFTSQAGTSQLSLTQTQRLTSGSQNTIVIDLGSGGL